MRAPSRFLVSAALFCAASLISSWCPAADDNLAERQVELKAGDRIIFFGDSLTALAGKEAPKEHVTKGYVRIVRETLETKHASKNIEVDWVATGGHTVPDMIKRVDNDVLAKKPTIVVIQIGCNDARRIPADDDALTARKVPRQRLLQQPQHPAEVLSLVNLNPHRVPHPIEIMNDAEPFPNDRGIQLVRPAKDAEVKIVVTIARKLDGDAFGHVACHLTPVGNRFRFILVSPSNRIRGILKYP